MIQKQAWKYAKWLYYEAPQRVIDHIARLNEQERLSVENEENATGYVILLNTSIVGARINKAINERLILSRQTSRGQKSKRLPKAIEVNKKGLRYRIV